MSIPSLVSQLKQMDACTLNCALTVARKHKRLPVEDPSEGGPAKKSLYDVLVDMTVQRILDRQKHASLILGECHWEGRLRGILKTGTEDAKLIQMPASSLGKRTVQRAVAGGLGPREIARTVMHNRDGRAQSLKNETAKAAYIFGAIGAAQRAEPEDVYEELLLKAVPELETLPPVDVDEILLEEFVDDVNDYKEAIQVEGARPQWQFQEKDRHTEFAPDAKKQRLRRLTPAYDVGAMRAFCVLLHKTVQEIHKAQPKPTVA